MIGTGEAIFFSLLLGFFLGVIYTAVRIFAVLVFAATPTEGRYTGMCVTQPRLGDLPIVRPPRSRGKVYRLMVVFILDILFCLTAAAFLSIFVYSTGGIFRLSYVTVALFGLLLFVFTLGKWTEQLLTLLLFGVRVLVRYVFLLLSIPIFRILSILRRFVTRISLIFTKLCVKIKVRIYRWRYKRASTREKEKWEKEATALAVHRLFPE